MNVIPQHLRTDSPNTCEDESLQKGDEVVYVPMHADDLSHSDVEIGIVTAVNVNWDNFVMVDFHEDGSPQAKATPENRLWHKDLVMP